jgi:hypothetical protein
MNQAKGAPVTPPPATLVPCFMCNKEAQVDWLGRCEPCFRAYLDNPVGISAPTVISKVQLTPTISATPAHINDIKSRRLAEDGKSTVREKGSRIYFTR